MALSNIFREPRREIIETLVGLAVVGPVILADYGFGRWLQTLDETVPLVVGMLLGAVVIVLVVCGGGLLAVLTHALGEDICNALERHGHYLRPRRRY